MVICLTRIGVQSDFNVDIERSNSMPSFSEGRQRKKGMRVIHYNLPVLKIAKFKTF